MRLKNQWATLMVESSCHHAIFDDGGLALGYIVPPPPLAAQGSPATARRRPPRPTGSTGWPWRKRQLRLLLVLASLWPCTEPSNRSGGSEKHAPISDIIYYNSNVWHSTLQKQKGQRGQNPFCLGLPGPVGKLARWQKENFFFCFKVFSDGDVLILGKSF